MKAKIIFAAIAGFAAGCGTYALLDTVLWSSSPDSVADHWRVVKEYRAFMRNPTNGERDSQTGLISIAVPVAPMPSLAALVTAGELEHVDMVFPVVPKTHEATRFWMKWCEGRDDILCAFGNPQYVHYKPSGEQPLHLQLWFRRQAKPAVQQLIRDLESLAKGNKPASAVFQIPPHALRERFLGDWQEDGETALVIAAHSDGTVMLQPASNRHWKSVINNVRWDGDELCYDLYMYYQFGDHAYSGIKNNVTLTLAEEPDRLKLSVFTEHTPQPIEGVLARAKREVTSPTLCATGG